MNSKFKVRTLLIIMYLLFCVGYTTIQIVRMVIDLI